MRKKVLSCILALCIVCTLFPATAIAIETDGVTGDEDLATNNYYEFDDIAGADGGNPNYLLSGQSGPDMTGDTVDVNASTAQDVLDGKYGDITGKTINFTEDITDVLDLARPTKYEGSKTVYYNYVNSQRETTPTEWSTDISSVMNSHSHYYRTLKGVTFTADEGVSVAGFTFGAGHVYGSSYDYVRDMDLTEGVTYYKHSSLEDITFEGLTITGRFDAKLYLDDSSVSGITFDGCTFTGTTDNGVVSKNAAVKFLADNQYFTDITVRDCDIDGYFQGVYIGGVDGATITDNSISNTTHNAIALQSNQVAVKGTIDVRENYISNASDRAIRFNEVDSSAKIIINNNIMVNCGDEEGQLIKATSVAEGASVDLESNYWDGKDVSTAVDVLTAPTNVGITGGTWSSDVSAYMATGFEMTKNDDGTYSVSTPPVAIIGNTTYASLQAAVNEGGEVTLLKSIKESVTVPADKTVILNLNNCTLENSEGQHTITVSLSGSLTIEGHGTVDNISHAKAAVYNNGTIVLSGGTFTRSKENGTTATENGGNSFYNIVNHGTMTIEEGVSVSQSGGYSSMIENGYYNYDNEHQDGTNASEPSLTINGGNFSGGLNTVKNDDNGKLTIHGGTFTNNKQAVVLNWNEAEINGGTLDGSQASHAVILNGGGNNTTIKGKLSITGGSFDGGTKPVLAAMNNDPSYLNKNNISVTNGTFSDPSVKDFIPEGSQLTTTEDGKFVLAPASGSVAAVGNQGYQTLAEAINAAQDGDTVKLLQSAAGGGVVFGNAPARNLTIDLGENTYTVTNPTVGSPGTETNGFQLLKGNTITFINGTVKAGSAAKILFQNYCDLTLKNVTVDCRESSQCQYAVSNNHGDTVIEDSKIYAAEGQKAFDVFYWPQNGYGDGVSVTVKGSSEIIGTVEYGSDGTDSGKTGIAEKAKLNIEGGSFKGTISTSNLGTDGKTGIQISGGTFDHEIPSAYCAENFAPVKNSDGTYSVMKPSVSLPQTASVRRGNTTTLTATVTPAGSVVTQVWKSENEAIATVDENGKVTGVASGEAAITVTIKAGEKVLGSATCAITVYTGSSGGGGGGSGSSSYAVRVDGTKHGAVTVSPQSASKGTAVTVTVKPDSGYKLDELTVTDKDGKAIKLTDKGSGKYTFTMPASKVTVEASFVPEAPDPDIPGFTDVPASAYYYDSVMWAVEQGITSGTSATTFSPDTSCTRAQMVTFLWRAAGSPAPRTSSSPFMDVQPGTYYYDAVLWAVEQGITSGTSATTFSPGATVTRGQTVTFLYRAAGSTATGTNPFTDVADSAYYANAVKWAVAEGITSGTSAATFSPDQACTRAQIVTFLYRANA